MDQTALVIGRIENPCDPWIIPARPATLFGLGLPEYIYICMYKHLYVYIYICMYVCV